MSQSFNCCVDCHALVDVAERGIVERCERCEALKWFKEREPLVVNVYNSACDVCVGDDAIKQLSTHCQALLRFETVQRKPGGARR